MYANQSSRLSLEHLSQGRLDSLLLGLVDHLLVQVRCPSDPES